MTALSIRTRILVLALILAAAGGAIWLLTAEWRAYVDASSTRRSPQGQVAALNQFLRTPRSFRRMRAAEERIEKIEAELRSAKVDQLATLATTDPDSASSQLSALLSDATYASNVERIQSTLDDARSRSASAHCVAARDARERNDWDRVDRELLAGIQAHSSTPACQAEVTAYASAMPTFYREAIRAGDLLRLRSVRDRLVLGDGSAFARFLADAGEEVPRRLDVHLGELGDLASQKTDDQDPAPLEKALAEIDALVDFSAEIGIAIPSKGRMAASVREVLGGVLREANKLDNAISSRVSLDQSLEGVRKLRVFLTAQTGLGTFSGFTETGRGSPALFVMPRSSATIEVPTWFTGYFVGGMRLPARNAFGMEIWVPHFTEAPEGTAESITERERLATEIAASRRYITGELRQVRLALKEGRALNPSTLTAVRLAITNARVELDQESLCARPDVVANLTASSANPRRISAIQQARWDEWVLSHTPITQLAGCPYAEETQFKWSVAGDVDVDGRDEALVLTWQSAGASGWSEVLHIVGLNDGLPHELGAIECGKPDCSFQSARASQGILEADLTTWEADDPGCCPSGKHTDRWRFEAARLVPVSPGNRSVVRGPSG